MDLLDDLRQKTGNPNAAYRKGARGPQSRKAQALLLAGLPSSSVIRRIPALGLLLVTCGVCGVHAENPPPVASSSTAPTGGFTTSKPQTPFQKETMKVAPSFQEKKWTGTLGAYETNVQYDYVGRASQNLGLGRNGPVDEQYVDVRENLMRHTLLVFLAQGGMEYQHQGFGVPSGVLVPQRLDSLYGDIALDTHWSEKDLLHIEGRPGFYTDFEGSGWKALNAPIDVGYTRVVSDSFQWVLGFNYNSWRSTRFLGAPGFRWQINDRWRVKVYMPTPDIEYYARPNVTLTLGGDFRGESYRVGPHFGDSTHQPGLNNALVDYQEARVGPGFSWNVRPLIEINFMTGYMIARQFDFHDNGVVLNGSSGPFVSLAIHALFKFPGAPLVIPQRNNVSLYNILSYF